MKKESVNKTEVILVSLPTTRTNLKNEVNPQTSKIGTSANRFWSQQISNQIPHRKNSGVTLSVYTDYQSDEYSDYTYFMGKEVNFFENTPTIYR